MGNKPVYWAEQNTFFSWNYKDRTALTKAFTLQVSGRLEGTRHRVTLYRITPEGLMIKTWSQRFRTGGPTSQDKLRMIACNYFIQAARGDPVLRNRLTIEEAIEAAQQIIEAE